MIEKITFENIKGKFENIDVYISTVDVFRFEAIDSKDDVAFSNILEDVNFHYYAEDEIDFAGRVFVQLRNQSKTGNTILDMQFVLRTKSKGDIDKANTFTKTLQFIYDWVQMEADQGNIANINGERFIVPRFGYSRAHFEKHFESQSHLYNPAP